MLDHKIPARTNRILHLILLGLLLIFLRVWYLSVIQREHHLQESRKPQRRFVMEKVERGTIRDRFNTPLALNQVQYNAAVCYSQIRQIPRFTWNVDEKGKRAKTAVRSSYITNLAQLLGKELEMDSVEIEDVIHGKASLFPHTSFVLKEGISERQYYRLKMLEKDWVGIQAERGYKRFYPQGKVACDVLGYMGAIADREYTKIAQEMQELQSYLTLREEGEMVFLPKGFNTPVEVRERLKTLQEKAYTLNDVVGKSGVEASFDQQLRGSFGKTIYEVDTKGNRLRELPGSRPPLSSQRLILTLSAELQQFAESLLIEFESFQDERDERRQNPRRHPWQRGSAIVVLEPRSGEVLTLASYPRFDPNDFLPTSNPPMRIKRQTQISKWLENEAFIGDVWNGKAFLERELSSSKIEKLALGWELYLNTILPLSSPIRAGIDRVHDLKTAFFLLQECEQLLHLSKRESMQDLMQLLYGRQLSQEEKELYQSHKQHLDPYLFTISPLNDKLLLLDLCRLLFKKEALKPELLQHVGDLPLSSLFQLSQAIYRHGSELKECIRNQYHQTHFKAWRKEQFAAYLKEKRREEREKKRYARPYTDYLEFIEKKMFKEFWEENHLLFLESFITGALRTDSPLQAYLLAAAELRKKLAPEDAHLEKLKGLLLHLGPLALDFVHLFRPFDELNDPLWGKYPSLRNRQGKQLQKHLAAAFYPVAGFGYGRSQAFRQAAPLGSVFKLLTAYEALHQNPDLKLVLDEQSHRVTRKGGYQQIAGYFENGQPFKWLYKGGLLPRKFYPIGRIDLPGAFEVSSNLYFSILAGDYMASPQDLLQTARQFGFGEKTGIEIPGEFSGHLPEDLEYNRTGLYAFAIGQHSLTVTPLQTALMMSTLSNHGKMVKPKLAKLLAGKAQENEEDLLFSQEEYHFKEQLANIGIHFPLFTELQKGLERPYVSYTPVEDKRSLFFSELIENALWEGMRRTVMGMKGTARPSVVRALYRDPKLSQDYINLQGQLIGKTGTAEILYKQTIDTASTPDLEKHVWFAGISFSDHQQQEPELIIAIYLRFGDAGAEAAPLAARLAQKWRDITSKSRNN